jgi:hypothetical protein
VNESFRPKSASQTLLFFFLVLVPLSLLVVQFDAGLVEQMRRFVRSGRWPDFADCTRLVAYVIAPYAVTRLIGKFPGWLTCPAYFLSVLICLYAFWL